MTGRVLMTVVLCGGFALTAPARDRDESDREQRERRRPPAVERGAEAEWRARDGRERQPAGAPVPRRPEDDSMLLLRLLGNPAFAERLGLSDGQRDALVEEARTLQDAIAALQTGMQQQALRQAGLIAQPDVDEAELMAAVEALGELRTGIAKLRMRQMLLLRQHLSPEQLQQMRGFMRQQRAGRDGRPDGPTRDTPQPRKP